MSDFENLLVALQEASDENHKALLTLEFSLSLQPQEVQEAIEAAAIPNWFDRAMLSSILSTDLNNKIFSQITSLPYVETYGDIGWNVHEKTKDILRKKIRKEDKDKYKKLSRKAAAFCRKFHSFDSMWQAEGIYHSLVAEERKSEEHFINFSTAKLNKFSYAELEGLLRPILSAAKADWLSARAHGWALFIHARIINLWGNASEAIEELNQALKLSSDDARLEANCKQLLGDIYMRLADYDAAKTWLESSRIIWKALKAPISEANSISSLGQVYYHVSEFSKAKEYFILALKLYSSHNDRVGVANSNQMVATLEYSFSNYDVARKRYETALGQNEKIGNHVGIGGCLLGLARIETDTYNLSKAVTLTERAITVIRSTGDRLSEANAIRLLGNIHMNEYNTDRALEFIKDALKKYIKIGDRLGEVHSLQLLGSIYLLNRRPDVAEQYYLSALNITQSINDPHIRAQCLAGLGRIYSETKDIETALVFCNEAESIFRSLEVSASVAFCCFLKGLNSQVIKDYENALIFYNSAIAEHKDAIYYSARAGLNSTLGNFDEALNDLSEATKLNPNIWDIDLCHGKISLYNMDIESAEKHFNAAANKCPKDGEILIWQAVAQCLLSYDWQKTMMVALNLPVSFNTLKLINTEVKGLMHSFPIESLTKLISIISLEIDKTQNIIAKSFST